MDRHHLCSGADFDVESCPQADYHDGDADNMEWTESDESSDDTDDESHANHKSNDEYSVVSSGHMEAPDPEKLDAIKRLTKIIVRFEDECTAGISALKQRTKEMIDLVSILTLPQYYEYNVNVRGFLIGV